MYGTVTQSQTFTITNARYLASKVKTDLSRMRQFYNAPTEARINEFETELIALLSGGYLTKVSYGFRRNNAFVPPTLEYTAAEFADGSVNDRPGGVAPGADISGATFTPFSKPIQSSKTSLLPTKQRLRQRCPSNAEAPILRAPLVILKLTRAISQAEHRWDENR